MYVSRAQVEQILKTLPIGYYLHHNVNVELTDEESSNHNALTDDIHISFPQLQQIFNEVDENDVEVETFVRTMLYHEVGHALLTPSFCAGSQIMNIFEDERLETLLENYFLNVKFKKMIKLAAHYNPASQPTNPMEMFFEVVRFRKGPAQFVDQVSQIILRYANTTKTHNSYMYTWDVQDLYNEIKKWFEENEQQTKQTEQAEQAESNDDTTQLDAQTSINATKMVDEGDMQLNDHVIQRSVQTAIETALTYEDNMDISEQLNQIFAAFKSTESRLGTAIQARSGMFDPRSVVRDDYKWWVQKNRQGNVKAFAKLKLNLFIDCSGSFADNDKIVNCMLKALIKLEKINPDFQFDLIRCGEGEELCQKHKRRQHSDSGTQISPKIESIYHQVQQRGWKNVNICLYDGDFSLDELNMKDKLRRARPISVFNNQDSICIFDKENQTYADTYLKNGKVVISSNYTEELIKHVMAALQSLCKI